MEFSATDDENVDACGEASRGLLEAVLASNLLSEAAREEINSMISDSLPALEEEKTIGHFRFRWTEVSADARDNTNEANIDATGAILNDCWDRYVADFRRPQAEVMGGQRIIDVDVYREAGLHGSTSSQSNRIFLNSETVVNDDCRRRTTSAHELFHRVEYSYGYVTGTAGQRWWVEALGSWSQEYYAPDVDDYINRVNSGLSTPAKGLFSRSYDACHYWKYLGEQLSRRNVNVTSEEQAIREVLDEYATNGNDAKAASGKITQVRASRTFDRFFQDWSKANYIKDLDNPFIRYEYLEDENVTASCGRNYGPYRHVAPLTDETIISDTFTWTSGIRMANAYGTNYHHFEIDPSVTQMEMRFEGNVGGGSGMYSVHLIMIKADHWSKIYNGLDVTDRTWNLSFTSGRYDRCMLAVNGLATGGAYEIGVNACMSGVWRDSRNFIWTLTQSGNQINGTVVTTSCGTYDVAGTLNGNDLVLNATGGACCKFEYRGSVVDCATASGDWDNDCGGAGVWDMRKIDPSEAAEILADEAEEFADDPATMQG